MGGRGWFPISVLLLVLAATWGQEPRTRRAGAPRVQVGWMRPWGQGKGLLVARITPELRFTRAQCRIWMRCCGLCSQSVL